MHEARARGARAKPAYRGRMYETMRAADHGDRTGGIFVQVVWTLRESPMELDRWSHVA
jgi:hypothetical protein